MEAGARAEVMEAGAEAMEAGQGHRSRINGTGGA
jgi:hypothetical protein